ncbi:MAG: hypothetical protein WCL16_11430, partial [bacterium]
MKQKTISWLGGVVAMVLMAQSAAMGGLAVSYVKTLGQTNVKGQPFRTAGSRISVDKDANLYLCGMVTSPWNALVKLAPDGRIIWQSNCGGYYNIATAIDGEHVYVATANLLRRFTVAGGTMDAAWGFGNVNWGPGAVETMTGFPRLAGPRSLIVSGSYLYVVDTGRDELLRVDKATGKEHPFNSRLMVLALVDIAKAKNGNLLLLTGESVFEVDAEGNPGKGPLIDGFAGAVAIDVEPGEGKIYIAIGGVGGDLVNTINEYSAAGKPTGVKIGRGGGYSGAWAADQLAFAAGRGDIVVDPTGGIWVGNDGRSVLPTLLHFDRNRKPDGLLMGLNGNGLVVDSDLNVTVGGSCKLSWDNKPLWTSGLVTFGDLKQYPTVGPDNWWFTVAYADLSAVVVFNPAAQTVMALSATTGALLNGPYKAIPALAFCSAGKSVFYVKEGGIEKLDVAALDKPTAFFKPSDGAKFIDSALAVSADYERIYGQVGDKITCYRKDGAKLWEVAAKLPMALMKSVLWVSLDGGGVLALDAGTGQSLGVLGNKAVDGRLPVSPASLAVGAKDGK